jgi:hypothetical protein
MIVEDGGEPPHEEPTELGGPHTGRVDLCDALVDEPAHRGQLCQLSGEHVGEGDAEAPATSGAKTARCT